MIIWNNLLEYLRSLQRDAGYIEIKTPQLLNQSLWETSGHWNFYKENMYSPMEIDEQDYATHCFLKAVELDYANADGYYYLGLVAAMKARYSDAAEYLNHALDIRSEFTPALRDLALVYLAMARPADALQKINKARSLSPADSQLKSIERKIRLSQTTEAIADFFSHFRPLLPKKHSF